MKNITLFLLTLLLFVSCNNDNHFSGYYEEDEEDYVNTVKIEQPQPLIYCYDHVNKTCKDTIVTLNCYNDGFSINGIRYNAEKVIGGKNSLELFNVTSEETGEYYYYVTIYTWNDNNDNSLMHIVFWKNGTTITKEFYDEFYRN